MSKWTDITKSLSGNELDDLLDAMDQDLILNPPSNNNNNYNAQPVRKESFTKTEFGGRKKAEKDKMVWTFDRRLMNG
jgi:hypothetical protein